MQRCTSSLGASSPPPSASHGTRNSATSRTPPSDRTNSARHGAEPERSARSASRISHRTSSSLGCPNVATGSSTSHPMDIDEGKPVSSKPSLAASHPSGNAIVTGGPPPGPGPRAGRGDPSSPVASALSPPSSVSPPPSPPRAFFLSPSSLTHRSSAPWSMSAGESLGGGGTPFASVRTSASAAPLAPASAQLSGACTHIPRRHLAAQSVSARVGGSRSSCAASLGHRGCLCFSAAATLRNVTSRMRPAWSESVVRARSRNVETRRSNSSRVQSGLDRSSRTAAKSAYCSARRNASVRRAPARRCANARPHSPSARPRSSAAANARNSGSQPDTGSESSCQGGLEYPPSFALNGGGLSTCSSGGMGRRRGREDAPEDAAEDMAAWADATRRARARTGGAA